MKRILFIIGFVSLLSQIVLIRELNAASFGVELIYTLAIGFWLAGTALGAAIRTPGFSPSVNSVYILMIVFSVLIPSEVIFIRGIRSLSGQVSGAYLPFTTQLSALIISLIPVSLISGLAFQWGAKLFISKNKTLAEAYAIESAGGIAGGVFSTILIMLEFSNFQSCIICSISILALFFFKKQNLKFDFSFFFFSALLAAFIVMFISSASIDKFTASWNNKNIIETTDTPYNRISVSFNNGQYSVFEDDALSFDSESFDAEEFCQIPLLMHKAPERILILGGGYKGIITEVLKHKNMQIDYVEYNKKMIDLLRPWLGKYLPNPEISAKVNYFYDDPRDFLQKSGSYDLIIASLPEPASGQTNRFYTKEFFKLCKNNLEKHGIFTFRLGSDENLWSLLLTKRNTGLFNTLKSEFSHAIVLPGSVNIFIASNSPIEQNVDTLAKRLSEKRLDTKIVSSQYIKYVLQNDRYNSINSRLLNTSIELNTDTKPYCYQYTTAIWLSKFFPVFAGYNIAGVANKTVYFILIILSLFFFLSRRFKSIKKYLLIFLVSLQGMIFEIILILRYQTEKGILFQNIGILLTSFMAGLCIGAFFSNKLFINKIFNYKYLKPAGYVIILAFALLNILTGYLFGYGFLSGLFSISIFIMLDGFLVSALFTYLSTFNNTDKIRIISPLYSADLLGGCTGAIITGLILIPLFGLNSLLIFSAVVSVLSLIIL